MVAETSTYVGSLIRPKVHITEITTAKTVAEVTKRASPRVSHHNPNNPLLAETIGGPDSIFWAVGLSSAEFLGTELSSFRRFFSASILASSS